MESDKQPVVKSGKPTAWVRVLVWVLVAGVLLGTLLLAKPLYREGKAWRARRLSLQVEQLVGEGRLEEAMEKARAAYQLKPDEPASIRAVAWVEGASRRYQSALGFWRQLRETGAMGIPDRKRQAEDLLRAGLAGVADEELRELIVLQPGDARLERLAAQAAFNIGNRAAGRQHAERALELEPESGEGRLLMGLLLWDATDPSDQRRGLDLVCGVAADPGRPGLDALLALSRRTDLGREQVERLAELASAHPRATGAQRLLALDMRLRAYPEKAGELMDQALHKARDGTAEDRRSLGVWFNNRKEYDRALKAVPIEEASMRKDLLLVHLDALAALKRWDAEEEGCSAGRGVPGAFSGP